MRIMRFVTILSAAAILLAAAVSAPTRSAAADPGIGDGPPISAKPPRPGGPGIRTIQSGESITIQKGERVRVMLPKEPAFVGEKQSKSESDEAKLSWWLKGRKGLTFAQVQAYIAAEKLTIPQDALTGIQNALEGTGAKPGPSSDASINRLILISTRWATLWIYNDNLGESQRNVGIVGGASNSGRHTMDVPVSITKIISSSASVTTGVTAAVVSAQVGFNVTLSESVTTGIVVRDVRPNEYIQVRGWKAGDLVLYEYDRIRHGLYYNTVTREFEDRIINSTTYRGNAFHAMWLELEALQ